MERRLGPVHHHLDRHLGARAHNLDPQLVGADVQLFDPHKGAHRLRFGQNALGKPFSQGFQQVQTFGGQFGGNGFGDAVIRQDAVDIVIQRLRRRPHLDHDVEHHPLAMAAFLLKCTDLNLDHMIAQGNAVTRVGCGRRDGTLFRMGEGKADVAGHGSDR